MKKYIYILLYLHITKPASVMDAANFGVSLFGAMVSAEAQVKMKTEGYKQEVINGLYEISNMKDREETKVNNLQKISLIKNEIIRRIEKYNSENDLTIKPLLNVMYVSYKNFINATQAFIKKQTYLAANKNKNNIKKTNNFIKVALYTIKKTFLDYIFLRGKYNIQLGAINQSIQSTNQTNILNEANEKKPFLDFSFNIEFEIKDIDNQISAFDQKIDMYIREQTILETNNSAAFSSVTQKIIDQLDKIENIESAKDISSQSEKFYNMDAPLEEFKSKLFTAFDKFDLSVAGSEAALYRIILLLDISTNKINQIISLLTTIENNPNYTVEDFFQSMYDKFKSLKKDIKISQKKYIEEVSKKNNNFSDLFKKIKEYLAFIKQNNVGNTRSKPLSFDTVNEIIRQIRKMMYEYYNYFQIKNRTLENNCFQIGYVNEAVVNTIKQIDEIYLMQKKEKKKQKKTEIISDQTEKNINKIEKQNAIISTQTEKNINKIMNQDNTITKDIFAPIYQTGKNKKHMNSHTSNSHTNDSHRSHSTHTSQNKNEHISSHQTIHTSHHTKERSNEHHQIEHSKSKKIHKGPTRRHNERGN